MQNIQDMQDRIAQLPAEIQEARKAARKERAQAIFDGRTADQDVLNRPAELEEEQRQLPDSLFDAKVQALAKQRDDQRATAEQAGADKRATAERMKAAREAKEKADREYNDADKAHGGAMRKESNASRRAQEAETKLNDLYENGLDSTVDVGASV